MALEHSTRKTLPDFEGTDLVVWFNPNRNTFAAAMIERHKKEDELSAQFLDRRACVGYRDEQYPVLDAFLERISALYNVEIDRAAEEKLRQYCRNSRSGAPLQLVGKES